MHKFNSIVEYLIWPFAALLVFLVVFESSVVVPPLIQPLGRMHPLILHFPIVMIILIAALKSLKDRDSYRQLTHCGIMLAALITIITSIMGMLLSLEDTSDSLLLTNHKLFALTFTVIVITLTLPALRKYQKLMVYGSIPVMVLTAHFGGSLTHGRNYVLAPLEDKESDLETQPIFEAVIVPIYDRKCVSCHNPDKRKGQLDLSSLAAIRKGGKSGPLWDVAGDSSLLIERIKLPLTHEDHMPPEGKPQLIREEVQLLASWISSGADFTAFYSDLQSGDSLLAAINAIITLKTVEENRYAFDAISDSEIEALNTSFRSVSRLYMNANALEAAFFVRSAFSIEDLSELLKIKEQLVSLDLSYMPITDDDLDLISRFPKLERLNLNYTNIDGLGLVKLASLENLRSVSLAGSGITQLSLNGFNQEQLDVYVWDTPLDRFESESKNINIHFGYEMEDEEPIKLSAPAMATNQILNDGESIKLVNSFQGSQIRFTQDGTDPDSTSTLYNGSITFERRSELRARSFKENWIASDVAIFNVFKPGIKPDSIVLLTPTEKINQARTADALINQRKGALSDFGSKEWLAYRKRPFESWMDVGEQEVQAIILTYGVLMGAYIMPPSMAEVWGSHNGYDFQLIERQSFEMPNDYILDHEGVLEFEISMPFRFYKLKVKPVPRLPSWHVGAGDEGWVFLDEMFVY